MKRHRIRSKYKKFKGEKIFRLILPSVVGILLCLVCLAGSTLAWLTANVETSQSFQAANYSLTVTVTDSNGAEVTESSGSYTLADGTYTVTLNAAGTAGSCYCSIESSAGNIYIAPVAISNGAGDFTFTINTDGETLTFSAGWGEYSNTNVISNGGTLDLTTAGASLTYDTQQISTAAQAAASISYENQAQTDASAKTSSETQAQPFASESTDSAKTEAASEATTETTIEATKETTAETTAETAAASEETASETEPEAAQTTEQLAD